ncbi:MAG: hypothetical protein ABUT20_54735 [Bacteroidota bacterium]
MKMLPFFIASILLSSCAVKNNTDTKTTVIDTIIPAMDTGIANTSSYNRYEDSVERQHERDSFYAIKPAYLFTSSGKASGFDKLIAAAINTSTISSVPCNFVFKHSYTYNKDSMPVAETSTYTNSKYHIRIVNQNVEDYLPKKIFINGRQLRWGIDIDTTFSKDFISYNIELTPEECKLVQLEQKEYLLLSGAMEKCNGSGCGVAYFLLFDPVSQKAIAIQQFRINEPYIGSFNNNSRPGFLMFDDYDYNYLYNIFTVSAKAYSFSKEGKILPAKDNKGRQYYFDGYSIDDPDSIVILKANFPVK